MVTKKKKTIITIVSLIFLLPLVLALNASSDVFNITTDKEIYNVNETVHFSIQPSTDNFSITLIHPRETYVITDLFFIPRFVGNYFVEAIFGGATRKSSTTFDVVFPNFSFNKTAILNKFSNLSLVANTTNTTEKQNNTDNITNQLNKSEKNISLQLAELKKKFFNRGIKFSKLQKLIDKKELLIEKKFSNTKVKILGNFTPDNITEVYSGKLVKEFKKQNKKYRLSTDVFAINELSIESADIELSSFGEVDSILYCKNFNFNTTSCPGDNWVLSGVDFTRNLDSVSFTVDHFSAWVGVTILENYTMWNGTFNQTQIKNTAIILLNDTGSTYYFNGTYTSEVFDAGKKVTWKNISWEQNVSVNTSINVSVHSCDDSNCSGESWAGPYTNNTLTELSLPSNQYFQYKAVLSTDSNQTTPKLYNVTFNYLNESLLVSGSIVPTTQNIGQNVTVSGYVNLTNGTPLLNNPLSILSNGEYVPNWYNYTDARYMATADISQGHSDMVGDFDLFDTLQIYFIGSSTCSNQPDAGLKVWFESKGHNITCISGADVKKENVTNADILIVSSFSFTNSSEIMQGKPVISFQRAFCNSYLTLTTGSPSGLAGSTVTLRNTGYSVTDADYGVTATFTDGSHSEFSDVQTGAVLAGYYHSYTTRHTVALNPNDAITGKPSACFTYSGNFTDFGKRIIGRTVYWALGDPSLINRIYKNQSGLILNLSLTDYTPFGVNYSSNVMELNAKQINNISWVADETMINSFGLVKYDDYGLNFYTSFKVALILDDLVYDSIIEQPIIDHLNQISNLTIITDDTASSTNFSSFDIIILLNDDNYGNNFASNNFLLNISGIPVLTTGPNDEDFNLSTASSYTRGNYDYYYILNNSYYVTRNNSVGDMVKPFSAGGYRGYRSSLMNGAVALARHQYNAGYYTLIVNNYSTTHQSRTAYLGYTADNNDINEYGWELFDRTIYWLLGEPAVTLGIDSVRGGEKTILVRASDISFAWNDTTLLWTEVTNGQTTGLPSGRYVQYKATFNGNGSVSPTLYNVTLDYETLKTDGTGFYNYTFQVPSPIGSSYVLVEAENDGITGLINISLNVIQIGITPPVNTFDGSTTDFDYYANLSLITNLVLENTSNGKISFGSQAIDVSGKNIDAYVKIHSNNISIDSVNLPGLNKSATLSLYNLGYNSRYNTKGLPEFVILKDGKYCGVPYCNISSYSNGVAMFDVAGFSSYQTKANLQITVWDTTDFDSLYGTHTDLWRNDGVNFYANLTYTNSTIADPSTYNGACSISFEKENYGTYYSMAWDNTNLIFNYTDASGFVESGRLNHTFLINCTEESAIKINTSDDVMINWNTSLNIFDGENDSETQSLSNEGDILMNKQTKFYANYTRSDDELIKNVFYHGNPGGMEKQSLVISDVDLDGENEIVVGEVNGNVYILNSSGGVEVSSDVSAGTSPNSLVASDLFGDSKEEIVYSDVTGYLKVLNSTLGIVFDAGDTGASIYSLDIADVNNDGLKEIIVTTASQTNELRVYNYSLDLLWGYDFGNSIYIMGVDIGDVNGDGIPDIAVGSQDDNVAVFNGTGTPLFNVNPGGFDKFQIIISDVDLDGENEVIIGERNGNVYILNSSGGVEASADVSLGTYPYAMAIADLFGDSKPEIVYSDNTGYLKVLNSSLGILYDAGDTGAAITNIKINELKEIIVTTASQTNELRIYNSTLGLLQGYDFGNQIWYNSIDLNDLSNDGVSDIAVASKDMSVGLFQTAQCQINFNDSTSADMVWNSTLNLWAYNRTFLTDGVYDWNVTCYKGGYESQFLESNITVQPTPDLNLTSVTHPNIWDNETMYVYINISNDGTATATDANVSCYFDNVLFDSYIVTISAGSYNYSNCSKTVLTGEGGSTYSINVTIDESDNISEVWENNNDYNGEVNISQTTSFNFSIKTDTGSTHSTYLTGQDVNFWVNFSRSDDNNLVYTTLWDSKENGSGSDKYFVTGSGPQSVFGGDFDGDGSLDLATADYSGSRVSVFFNVSSKSSGTSSDKYFVTSSSPQSVFGGDFDGDGNLDLATADRSGNRVSVFFNVSNKTSGTSSDKYFVTGSYPYGVFGGDFDGDGSLDLATADAGSSRVSVFFDVGNKSSGTSSDKYFVTGNGPHSVVAGDFDGDGSLDLATADYSSSRVSVFFDVGNKSSGTSSDKYFVTGSYPQSVFGGDFDGDGNLDLATADAGSSRVSVFFAPKLCTITINNSAEKSFKPDSALLKYNTSFSSVGNYTYNITCQNALFETQTYNGVIEITPDTLAPMYDFAQAYNLDDSEIVGDTASTKPKPADQVEFRANWTDNSESVNQYLFSWNTNGTWTNDSWTSFPTGLNGDWSNITKQVPSGTNGQIIYWKIYASDGASNVDNTSIFNFTVQKLNATITLDNFRKQPSSEVNITGLLNFEDGTIIENNSVYIYQDNVFLTNTPSNSAGHYKSSFNASTYSGYHEISVNFTASSGAYARNNETLYVLLPLINQSSISSITGYNKINVNETVNLSVYISQLNINPNNNLSSVWAKITSTQKLNTTLIASEDSYADSFQADTNFGTDSLLNLGETSSGYNRIYVKFDLSSIPSNAVIRNASLEFNLEGDTGNPVDSRLYFVSANWTESSITWNNQPLTTLYIQSNTEEISLSVDSPLGYKKYDVTSQVDILVNNQRENYGFVIRDANDLGSASTNKLKEVGSSEGANKPKLSIEYSLPLSTVHLNGSEQGGWFKGNYSLTTNYSWYFVTYYANLTDGFNYLDIYRSNFTTQTLSITINIDNATVNPQQNITITGTAWMTDFINWWALAFNNIFFWLNGGTLGNTTTDANGTFNYTFEALNISGNRTLLVNATDSYGIYGENSTLFGVKIPMQNQNATSTYTNTRHANENNTINISVYIPPEDINLENNLSFVWVNITLPTIEVQKIYLNGSSSGGIWSALFTNTSSIGEYNLSYYANLSDDYLEINPTTYSFIVERINLTLNLDKNYTNVSEQILIYGNTLLYNGTYNNISNRTIYSYYNGIANLTNNTQSNGNYSIYTYAPQWAGINNITVNLTTENGVYGVNEIQISNKIPLKSNPYSYITRTEHANINEKINVTVEIPKDNIGNDLIDDVWAKVTKVNGSNYTLHLNGNSSGGNWSTEFNFTNEYGTYFVQFFANLSSGFSEINPTTNIFYIEALNLTINLDSYYKNPTENTIVYGHISLYNNTDIGNIENNTLFIYQDSILNGTNQTDALGNYSINITSHKYSGHHYIKVNATDPYGITGQSENVTLNVKIPLLNQSSISMNTTYNHTNINDTINISVYIPSANVNPINNLSAVWVIINKSDNSQHRLNLNGNELGGWFFNNWDNTTTYSIYTVEYYANLSDGFNAIDNAQSSFTVETIVINISLNQTYANPGQNITITGTAWITDFINWWALAFNNIFFWLNGGTLGNTTTDANGTFNYTFETTSILGIRNITANASDANNIFGQKNTSFENWAQTLINYNWTKSYPNKSIFYLKVNWTRTDIGSLINGTFNLTLGNTSTFCVYANYCEYNFTIPDEVPPGNQELIITINNSQQYYETAQINETIVLETPTTIGTVIAPINTIYDMGGSDYPFLQNITLYNKGNGSIYGIWIINNSFSSVHMKSIEYISNDCSISLLPGLNCTFVYNITLFANRPINDYPLDWKANWSENNNKLSYAHDTSYYIRVSGNPSLDINLSSINAASNISITENLSETQYIDYTFYSVGNERLGESIQPLKSVFVDLVDTNMPLPWVNFNGSSSQWNDTDDFFDYINGGATRYLTINITITNYTQADYHGTINVTSIDDGGLQLYEEFKINITVRPNISISNNFVNITYNISQTQINDIDVLSIGNTPLTNVSLTYESINMPSSWIIFNSSNADWTGSGWNQILEQNQKSLNITIKALHYIPGTYTGLINISTTEGLLKQVNLSLTINPLMSISENNFSVNDNISYSKTFYFNISSLGNSPLTNVSINYEYGNIPFTWVYFDSNESGWDNSSKNFNLIQEKNKKEIKVVIFSLSAVEGNYSSVYNITTDGQQNITYYLNLSAEINPRMNTIDLLNSSSHHNILNTYSIKVNSTGNSKIQSVNIKYLNETLPALWIVLYYAGQQGTELNLSDILEYENKTFYFNITSPLFQDPGIYTAKLNVSTLNTPNKIINVSFEILTNSSWYVVPPINKSNEFVLNQYGTIANFTINNTGNVPLNFTIEYDDTGCPDYFCIGNPPGQNSPSSIFIPKDSLSSLVDVYVFASPTSYYDYWIKLNFSNASATPQTQDVYVSFNITNLPPQLVQLTTLPYNYTEINTSIQLKAIVSDDEGLTAITGLNLSSAYFNLTLPNGTIIHYDNETLYIWDDADEQGFEQDRKKFKNITDDLPLGGTYNLSFFIQDKSNNPIASNFYQFIVYDFTNISVSGGTIPADNVTMLHGQNVTISITLNNTGKTSAYNINVSAYSSDGWLIETKSLGNLATQKLNSTNITIEIPAGTSTNNYYVLPFVKWSDPDGVRRESNDTTQRLITVSSNPEITIDDSFNLTINHNKQKKFNFSTNSTGNSNLVSAYLEFLEGSGNIPATWFNPNNGDVFYGTISRGTARRTEFTVSIPYAYAPGNYTGLFRVTATGAQTKYANITIAVPPSADYVIQPNVTQTAEFALNEKGIVANFTINNTGNIDLNLSINYTSWGYTNYSDNSGLFMINQNVSGALYNPGKMKVVKGTLAYLILYQNGSSLSKTNVGVRANLSELNTGTTQMVDALFNITEELPVIENILFEPQNYTELNSWLDLKIITLDDSSLNISSLIVNITNPLSTLYSFDVLPPGQGVLLNGNWIKFNFTYNFTNTSEAGTYSVVATIEDRHSPNPYVNILNTFYFTVLGKTNLTIASQILNLTYDKVNKTHGQNKTLQINISNLGFVNAYNLTLYVQETSQYKSYSSVISKLTSLNSTMQDLIIEIKNTTSPRLIQITPLLSWINPDGTNNNNSTFIINATVLSNKQLAFANETTFKQTPHNVNYVETFYLEAVGNDNSTNVIVTSYSSESDVNASLSLTGLTWLSGINFGKLYLNNPQLIKYNVTVPRGKTPGEYNITLKANSTTSQVSFMHAVNVTPSFDWVYNLATLDINGISFINQEYDLFNITNTGNVNITFNFTLNGPITSYMNLIDTIKTLRPTEDYVLLINHTAPASGIYLGSLEIDDAQILRTFNVTYYAHFANLTIDDVSSSSDVLSGQSINVTAEFIYENTTITENTTYIVWINNTICPINFTYVNQNNTIIVCNAPALDDARIYDLKLKGIYNSPTGVLIYERTKLNTVHYRDVTTPNITYYNASDVQKGSPIQILMNATDNIAVTQAFALITYPNSTLQQHELNYTSGYWQATFTFENLGIHQIQFVVTDAAGNTNNNITDSFEVFEYKQFAGQLLDYTGVPVLVNFTIVNNIVNDSYSFKTNSTGHYNATIKTRIYDLNIIFGEFNVTVINVSFFSLPTAFLNLSFVSSSDAELSSDIDGFTIQSNMPDDAVILVDYTDHLPAPTGYKQPTIGEETNLKIYKCNDFNSGTGHCIGTWWQQVPSSINVNQNRLIGTISNIVTGPVSAIMYVEQAPINQPSINIVDDIINVSADHGISLTFLIDVENDGNQILTNIVGQCNGTICLTSNFNISFESITQLFNGIATTMDMYVQVPKGYTPGTYTADITISTGLVLDTAQIRVTVPTDAGFSVLSTNYSIATGSYNTGNTTLTVNNTGNIDNILTQWTNNNTHLKFKAGSLSLLKFNSITEKLEYKAPSTIGNYTYSYSLLSTYPGSTAVTNNLNMFVDKQLDLVSINPQNNLVNGQLLEINISPLYYDYNLLGVYTTSADNVTVSIDGQDCTNLSLVGDTINCYVPSFMGNQTQTTKLLLMKSFYRNGSASKQIEVNYSDIYPPYISQYNSSLEKSVSGNTTISAVAFDDGNLASVTASLRSPSGTIINPSVTSDASKNIYLEYPFTELGDYVITYTLQDSLGNSQVLTKDFELFEYKTFSGRVKRHDSAGTYTNFYFYKPNDTTLISNVESDVNGNYISSTLHKRPYDIKIETLNTSINLRDVDISSWSDSFNMEPVSLDLVSVTFGDNDIMAVAINSSVSSIQGNITFIYDRTSHNILDVNRVYVYKCANWSYPTQVCGAGGFVRVNSSRLIRLDGLESVYVNLTGFSAYLVSEYQPQSAATHDIPTTTITYTTTGGGSSGTGGVTISEILPYFKEIKEGTGALTEAVKEISSKSKDVLIDTSQIERQLYTGESSKTKLHVKNDKNETIQLIAQLGGEITDLVSIANPVLDLVKGEESDFNLNLNIPTDTAPGIYTGEIALTVGNDIVGKIPVEVRVLESQDKLIDLKVQPITESIIPGRPARVQVDMYNLGKTKKVNVNLRLEIVDTELEKIIADLEKPIDVETTLSTIEVLHIPEDTRLGRYLIRGIAFYENNNKTLQTQSLAYISIETPWYNNQLFGVVPIWTILLMVGVVALAVLMFEFYERLEKRRKKYSIQLDLRELPQPTKRTAFIGNIAERSIRTFLELDKLQTHTIIAGATGGGKSVGAQVVVEEALRKGIAVIAFDPTAQWTGFLRRSKERLMLKQYPNFGMKLSEAKAFNGNVHPVYNSLELIDIKKFMNPGEISIFTLNTLTDLKEVDLFVVNTIRQVFKANLPESQELKLLLVYDEVHRLLPKFGGSGEGFIQIERACREFRKWGVGLVLISQVLSDFIGEIKANIGTEIQVRTRDEGDLERIKTKYGEDIMKSIVKASVGTGMLENAEYNKGRPYFVSFRPLLHSISRLSDEELKQYDVYNEKIDTLDFQIEELEKLKEDVFDLKLELKLALDKIKTGNFNMADIYLESLKPRVDSLWKKLGKNPPKRKIELANIDEIKLAVQKAKEERKKLKIDEQGKVLKNIKGKRSVSKGNREDKLEKYISLQLQKGVSSDSLKNGLISAGWPQGMVSEKLSKSAQKSEPIKVQPEELQKLEQHTSSEQSAKIEQKPKYPELDQKLKQLRDKISSLKSQGKDVSLLEIKIMSLPSDIQIVKITGSELDVEKIKQKISQIEQEVNKL